MCLLLGCDYLEPIKGVGPKTAYKLMQEHGNLEKVLEHLRAKWVLPVQSPKAMRLTGNTGLLPNKMEMLRMGRRSGVACKSLKNGRGRKPRNFLRILMLLPQTRLM